MKRTFVYSMFFIACWGCKKKEEQATVGLGDGLLQSNEVCDDGVNDGSYGGCLPDGSGLAPRCGDGKAETVTVWSENFDAYANLDPVVQAPGWEAFDTPENPAHATFSDTQKASGGLSLLIKNETNPVKTFRFITQGLWRLSYKVFIPSLEQTNNSAHYLVLLNNYPPYDESAYSLELKHTYTSSKVTLTCGTSTTGQDVTKDTWISMTIDFDFDKNELVVLAPGNKQVCKIPWTAARAGSVGAEKRLAALHLAEYSNPAPQKAYYDDFLLQRIEECDTAIATEHCSWSCRTK